MVHLSQMSMEFVKTPEDIVELGKEVKVRVMEIDEIAVVTDCYMTVMLSSEAISYIRHSHHWDYKEDLQIWVNRLMIPDGRYVYVH